MVNDINYAALTGVVRTAATGTQQLPGDFGVPTLSPLYVDGMPLAEVSEALRLAVRPVPGSAVAEQFWSTYPRLNGDGTREVYEFSLSVPRLVNRFSLSLAHFPQRVWIQYRDLDGVWQPVTQPGGSPIQITVGDSIPAVMQGGAFGSHLASAHPQHYGAGHWVAQDVSTAPVTASRFRLIMARIPSSSAPRDHANAPVPYSLGVKDVAVGYRLAADGDIPFRPLQDTSHTSALSQGQDILGSRVDYLLRRNRAASVLAEGGTWRSRPQPVPHAVVSMFLDMRMSDGTGQVVDRLLMEPLTSGPSVNLYYAGALPSKDWSTHRFTPSNEPLAFPQVKAVNSGVTAGVDGLSMPGDADGVQVDNQAIQFDPHLPFLLAGVIQPQVGSDSLTRLTLVDNGLLTVTLTTGVLTVRLDQLSASLDAAQFDFNASLPWAVAWDGMSLTVRTPWGERSTTGAVPRDGDALPDALMLGQPVDLSGGGLVRFRSLLLAQGRAGDIAGIEAYWADPAGYVLPRAGTEDPASSTTANALLRFDGSLVTAGSDSVCPLGLIGGPGVDYEAVVWTPVNGDFRLMREPFTFRPVKARLLKAEFTNLAPISVNLTGEPVVKVNLFPNGTSPGISTVAQAAVQESGAASAGVRVTSTTAQAYSDSPQRQQQVYEDSSFLPTETLFAPDPVDAQRLRAAGQPFRFLPLPGVSAPRWRTTGIHRYHVVETLLDTKTAYAVGVSRVRAYRTEPGAEQDSSQYIELFHDTSHLDGFTVGDPNSWIDSTQGALLTPPQVGPDGASVESITYVSRSKIMAVQFATTQSEAQQLVADPEMEDPSLRNWKPVGDASLSSSDAYATDIGQMALVRRGHADSSWDAMELKFATWDAVEGSSPDPLRPVWSELEQSSSEASVGGIQSVRGVDPPPKGRLYAAARVFTDKPLTTPLTLQLVNGDGRILAEKAAATQTSQVTEWVVDFDLGGPTMTTLRHWNDFDTLGSGGGVPTWDEMDELGSWDDVAQDMSLMRTYDVTVRLLQNESSGTGQWLVDSLAIFTDPIVWEFSRDGGTHWFEALDIRNNPRGVLVFPDLDPGDQTGGTQLRWRVSGYSPNLSVSSLVVRPWYSSLLGAVPHLDTVQSAGRSSSMADYYAPTTEDPFFRQWSNPVPQWWWLAAKAWRNRNDVQAVTPSQPLLPATLIEGTDEGGPASPAQSSLAPALIYPLS